MVVERRVEIRESLGSVQVCGLRRPLPASPYEGLGLPSKPLIAVSHRNSRSVGLYEYSRNEKHQKRCRPEVIVRVVCIIVLIIINNTRYTIYKILISFFSPKKNRPNLTIKLNSLIPTLSSQSGSENHVWI